MSGDDSLVNLSLSLSHKMETSPSSEPKTWPPQQEDSRVAKLYARLMQVSFSPHANTQLVCLTMVNRWLYKKMKMPL